MQIELIKAEESDFFYVKNLVPYYIYDMSQYLNWNPNDEGQYDGCNDLPDYWKNETWHPFLIKVDSNIGGFAMIRPYPAEPDFMDIGEFFILRKFTGQGVGKKSAFSLFDSFTGNWLVRVLDENSGALHFWEKIIHEYSRGDYIRSPEKYECQHSGTWNMQYFKFSSAQR